MIVLRKLAKKIFTMEKTEDLSILYEKLGDLSASIPGTGGLPIFYYKKTVSYIVGNKIV